MTGYSPEYKEMIVKRMLSEDAISVRDLVSETGVSRSTLYKWRNQYGLSQSDATKWSGEMKFAVLLETASLNETELAAYCRNKGLYVEDLVEWKTEAIQGYSRQNIADAGLKKDLQSMTKEAAKLKKDLERKDKALAEAAALLILSKKANAIWGEFEEE